MSLSSPPVPSSDAGARVLLVEDHPGLRRMIRIQIEADTACKVCGEAAAATQALELAPRLKPDLAVVDLSLGGSSNGYDLIKELKALLPELKVLVLSMHSEDLHAEHSLRAGALGYLTKLEVSEHLAEAIAAVRQGKVWLSERLRDRILPQLKRD